MMDEDIPDPVLPLSGSLSDEVADSEPSHKSKTIAAAAATTLAVALAAVALSTAIIKARDRCNRETILDFSTFEKDCD